jgi:tetratricopeptide (TPR) repeat protein
MTRRFDSTPKKNSGTDFPDQTPPPLEKPSRVPLWQALTLPLAAILIFFLLLEGGLALLGVNPVLKSEDPFVGFASNVPLFVPAPGPGGTHLLTTASNKLNFFNPQSFPRTKAPGSYRIFCLGGSTTYGRPYNDTTSFAGWLRELLPAADEDKNWEVINAGGISYASYRVAHLMEELVNYEPDLFVIYTGHNEFLEERTYNQIRKIPPVVRSTVGVLAKTRSWAAMTSGLQKLGAYPERGVEDRDRLAGEVDTILDRSAGPERYSRDDSLRENILQHYRISLERMVALARSAGAQVIFVTPASNLKDCSPFKSEHTAGLDSASRQRSEQLLKEAKLAIGRQDWQLALDRLDSALAFDPRHAELLYRRGRVLLAIGRTEEAEETLRMARDEDVCPLRALTSMSSIVAELAREQDVPLVDYVALLHQGMLNAHDHPIPGQEYFLDHVHPTIEGNKILAVELIKAMTELGLVRPADDWGEQKIARVAAILEGGIDKEVHGQALTNLARVLLWAGKNEDAVRLAGQALEIAGDYRQVAVDAASAMVTVYQRQKNPEQAMQLMYATLEKYPGALEFRFKLGQALLSTSPPRLEESAANLLLVCQQMGHYDVAHQVYGLAMARRGRTEIAHSSLAEALRLNPNNASARKILAQIRPLLGDPPPRAQRPNILLDVYPSMAPRRLVQLGLDPAGRSIPHGIEVEWHENGRLKRFLDLEQGAPNGLELVWGPQGELLSRRVYRQGVAVTQATGK